MAAILHIHQTITVVTVGIFNPWFSVKRAQIMTQYFSNLFSFPRILLQNLRHVYWFIDDWRKIKNCSAAQLHISVLLYQVYSNQSIRKWNANIEIILTHQLIVIKESNKKQRKSIWIIDKLSSSLKNNLTAFNNKSNSMNKRWGQRIGCLWRARRAAYWL